MYFSALPTACRLLVLCCCPLAALAQRAYPASAIPPTLLPHAASVVRDERSVFRIKSPTAATFEQVRAVTYLSPPPDNQVSLALPEGRFYHIRDMRATCYDASGQKMRENERGEVQTYGNPNAYEFTDQRIRVLTMVVPETPCTVEFSYKIEYEDFFWLPDWTVQTLGQATEHAEFTLVCPAGYRFRWQGVRTGLQPAYHSGENSWRWVAHHLPALPVEPHQPHFGGRYAYLTFAPEEFSMGEHRGSLRDWKSFGDFAWQLNENRDAVSAALAEKVRSLTAPCKTDAEKIAVLYRFLQENTRYVSVQLGVGGWQTFEAAYVEKKRYGDCKALSNYMRALLKAAGIPASLALVYGDDDGAPELLPDFADPAFNHMILYVPSTDTWLECTAKDQPAGYLGTFTSDRQALLLTPEGGRLVRTPRLDEHTNLVNTRTRVELAENGLAQLQHTGLLQGAPQEIYRQLASTQSMQDQQRYVTQHMRFSITRLGKFDLAPEADRPALRLAMDLEAPAYATRTGRRLFVPLVRLNPLERQLPRDTARTLDLYLPDAITLRDTVEIVLPPGFALENAPQGLNLSGEFGSYRIQTEQVPGSVRVLREAVLPRVQAPAARYEEIRAFFTAISQAEARQLVLVRTP